MDNANFNYWLQGYFELLGNQDGLEPKLTAQQVKCIRDHIKLVQTNTGFLESFPSWLQGYLDALSPDQDVELGTQAFISISNKLIDNFKHASAQVTPTYSAISPFTLSQPYTQHEPIVSYC